MTTISIVEIVNSAFLRRLKQEDDKFLQKIERSFEERRVMLVIQLRQSNSAMMAEYREKFARKVQQVIAFREVVLRDEQESRKEITRRAVEHQRDVLNKTCYDQITLMGTLCGRTGTDLAEMAISVQEVVDQQLKHYEKELDKGNVEALAKISKSAFDKREMQDYLEKEMASFKECDDIHVLRFSGTISRLNELFLRMIEDVDTKFRAYLASEIHILGDHLGEEELMARVEEHRKERDDLVSARFDPQDDEFILHNDVVNRKILDQLERECPGCFGHGNMSAEYYKYCGVQHEDGSCCNAAEDD